MKSIKNVLLSTLSSSRLLSAALIAIVLGSVTAQLLPPLVLEKIVNTLADGAAVPVILALTYFGAIFLSGILKSAMESFMILFGQRITFSLRKSMCAKLDKLPAEYFVSTPAGEAAARFSGDAETVESIFTDGIISMAADLIKIFSIFAIIFSRTKGLAIVLLLMVPFIFAFTRFVQKQMLKAQIKKRAAIASASGNVPETVKNIRTIHNLGMERYMKDRFAIAINNSFKASEKNNFYDAVYSPIIIVLNKLTVAAVMLLAASGIPEIRAFFNVSVGTAVALIAYIGQVFAPLESIGMEIQTIQSALAGVKRIDEFLSLEEREMPENEYKPAPEAPCVSLENTVFSYDGVNNVLNDLSFDIQQGQQVTLAGRTGAGKTTIFKLLLGLYSPQQGHVYIHGQDASRIPDKEKRKLFGWVEQSFKQVPGTILDQITLGDPSITREMAEKAAECSGIHQTIIQLDKGYDTEFSSSLFSQGQIQLLSIARSIAAEPEILLLDEITANLDAKTEKQVLDSLMKASENRTVISISHRLYQAQGGRQIFLN